MRKQSLQHALERFENAVDHLARDPRPLPGRLDVVWTALLGLRDEELGSDDLQRVYGEIRQLLTSAGTVKETLAQMNESQADKIVRLVVDVRDRLRSGVGEA